VVQRFIEAVRVADPEGNMHIRTEEYVRHGPEFEGSEMRGRAEGLERLRAFKEAMPDLTTEVHDSVIQGDRACMRVTIRGTQSGPFRGREGTGARFEVPGLWMIRVVEGDLIAEEWVSYDSATVMQQLGLMPKTAIV